MKILTPNGFQPFDGIKRWEHSSYIKFTFDDGEELSTSEKHRFIVNGDEQIYSDQIKVGDDIGKVVSNIERINQRNFFYDPVNVANGSVFNHDNSLVSHNTFFGTGDTLISAEVLLNLRSRPPINTYESGNLKVYGEPIENHQYVMTVDVSKGRSQDYSTFTIIDVSTNPFKQVAVYRNNKIPPLLYPNVIYKYAMAYNKAYIIVEANDQGGVVCNGLYHDLEYEEFHVTSSVKSDGLGIEMNRKVKRLGCSSIKDIIENHKLEIHDEDTVMEISTFEAKGTSYEASNGNHDDIMMNLVMFGYFAGSEMFADMTDINLKQMMYDQKIQEIDNDLPPFGFIDDGSDYIESIEQDNPYTPDNWMLSQGAY
jgi:intein/homing endonuclease